MVRGKIKKIKSPQQNGDKKFLGFSSASSEGPDQRSRVSMGQRLLEKAVGKPCLRLPDYRISSLSQAVRLRRQNPRSLQLRLSLNYREQHHSDVTQCPSFHQLSPLQGQADDLRAPATLMMSPSRDKAGDAMASSV